MKMVTLEDGAVLYQMRELHTNHQMFDQELAFYQLFLNGNVTAVEHMIHTPAEIIPLVGRMSSNPLHQARYSAVTMISICVRLGMLRGLNHELAYSLSDEIIQKIDQMNNPSQIIHKMSQFILELCRMIASENRGCYSKPIQDCINYITTHLYERITLDELAQSCHLNRNYLCQLFHDEVGETPMAYILDQKLEESSAMLLVVKQSMSEIASQLGFCSQSHFAKDFKAHFGCPPSLYYKAAKQAIVRISQP